MQTKLDLAFRSRWTSVQSYVIEPQRIFIPAVSEVLLEAGLEIAEFASSVDFRSLLEARPKVVFADLDFAQGSPAETIRMLRTLLPDALLMIYTSDEDPDHHAAFGRTGANGVFSKATPRHELVAAIRRLVDTTSQRDRNYDHLG